MEAVRTFVGGAFGGLWLFAWIFGAQLGHLVEHIAKTLTGAGLLGANFDSEESHLVFNTFIAIAAICLVRVYPRNPWVYPLVVLTILHDLEHIYIYAQYSSTGLTGGPGLLGIGGAIGVIPLPRLDLHNVYNGVEMVFMMLGLWNEIEERLAPQRTLEAVHASTTSRGPQSSRLGGLST